MSAVYFLMWCSIHAELGGHTGRWSIDRHLPRLMQLYSEGYSPEFAAIVTAAVDDMIRRESENSAAGLPL